jgi:S1-C subfamily serine protease
MTPYDDYPEISRRRAPQSRVWPPLLLILLCVAALAGGVFLYREWSGGRGGTGVDPNAQLREVSAPGPKGADEKARIDVIHDIRPSVVHIGTFALRRDFSSLNVQRIPEGTGSGFVWDKQGHIVTNYHVVRNADAAQVILTLEGGKKTVDYYARIVGVQPDMDLAVLYINAPADQLVPIKIGSSRDLQVGQDVLAIGNPFGLDWSVSHGIISALGREIESVAHTAIKNVIQTDAAINPGNSGGPLLDSSGRLIGVNTAIYSPSGASAGIGFAIPVDEVNEVVTQLIREGKAAPRPRLGVQVAEDKFARSQDVDSGALILGVVPGSAAAEVGLRPTRLDRSGNIKQLGDIIVGVDNREIKSAKDLFDALARHKPGETVTLTYLRSGERREVQVELQAAS